MEKSQFLADEKTREIAKKIDDAFKEVGEGYIIHVRGMTGPQKGAIQCFLKQTMKSIFVPSSLMLGSNANQVSDYLFEQIGGDQYKTERVNIFLETWKGKTGFPETLTYDAILNDLVYGLIYSPKHTTSISIFPPRIITLSCAASPYGLGPTVTNIFDVNCVEPRKKNKKREKFDVEKMRSYGYEVVDNYVYGFSDESGTIFKDSSETVNRRVRCAFDKIDYIGSDHFTTANVDEIILV